MSRNRVNNTASNNSNFKTKHPCKSMLLKGEIFVKLHLNIFKSYASLKALWNKPKKKLSLKLECSPNQIKEQLLEYLNHVWRSNLNCSVFKCQIVLKLISSDLDGLQNTGYRYSLWLANLCYRKIKSDDINLKTVRTYMYMGKLKFLLFVVFRWILL